MHNRTEHYQKQIMEVLIKMDKKEKTIERKKERKLKEYERGTFDISTLRQEIYFYESFRYQSGIFDGVKNDHQVSIEEQYYIEINQHLLWGNIF